MPSALVAASCDMGSASTSPLQLLMSKRAEYNIAPADTEFEDDAAPAMLRAPLAARLKMSSKACNTPRASLCR